uniref:Uncharacterized protein n=1 Tax=Myoviridae sp. ctBrv3 TaxID=2825047 RepID=A0A8S5PCS4_9CAUD|nr:MAG TPA: hypothetical protein [Myoviridae sp. ctBrv3]
MSICILNIHYKSGSRFIQSRLHPYKVKSD